MLTCMIVHQIKTDHENQIDLIVNTNMIGHYNYYNAAKEINTLLNYDNFYVVLGYFIA